MHTSRTTWQTAQMDFCGDDEDGGVGVGVLVAVVGFESSVCRINHSFM